MSDDTIEHVKIVQKLLQRGSHTPSDAYVVEILLKYVVSEPHLLFLDDFLLIDQYFLEHPDFFHSFSNDVLMFATFYLDSQQQV